MTVSNPAFSWTNIALNATLTASSEAAAMLVSKLQQQDTKRNWRTGAVTTAYILGTYSSNQSADTFFLANTNLTAAGIARIRLSSVDATGAAGDIYDSNSAGTAGQVDPNWKDLVVLASSVKSGWKYIRIDLTDTTLTYIEAGFLFVGTRTQLDIGYQSAQITIIDPSVQKKTKGGQTRIMVRPKYRRGEFSFEFISNSQLRSTVDMIDLLNGIGTPVLMITNPSSTNLGRDSIFGLLQGSSPVVLSNILDSTGAIMSSKQYTIDQRL